MDIDDRPRPLGELAGRLAFESLDHLSRDECDQRVALLQAEIARTLAQRSQVIAHKAAAEALFGKAPINAPPSNGIDA